MNNHKFGNETDFDRRNFFSKVGKGVGLAALTSPLIMSLLEKIQTASAKIEHLSPTAAAEDEDFWAEIQRAFPVSRSFINLNNGGVSPSPKLVTEALQRYEWQQDEATAYTMWQLLEPQSETIRTGLAELFGCDREELAITRNTSESLEILLFGMDLNRSDEILTSTLDYPRMLTALRQRELREKIAVKLVSIPPVPKNRNEIINAFEWGITTKTRLILVSHIVFGNGLITPVKEICELGKSKGIEVIVDGAHSFAHIDFKQSDIQCDYFGTSLHKWLFAPKGTGFLFVKRNKIENIWPLMAAEEKLKSDIRKFEEIGTHSAAPKLAIGEAILFHRGIGAQRKEARLRYLNRYWTNKLRSLSNIRFHTSFDDDFSCGIGTFEIVGIDPQAITGYLLGTHKILVADIKFNEFQGVRVTPNVYTTLPELDYFCEVITTVAKKGLPR